MGILKTVLLLGYAVVAQASLTGLSPERDVDVLDGEGGAVLRPLEWVGANGPYFAGPNVHKISRAVPDGCTVDQVAYVVRHGSRYPDAGAYAEWVALHAKIQSATFDARGELRFLKSWAPVLTDPGLQVAMEDVTGFKEAFDLGFALRTRYENLYKEGTQFISWANLYPRVVQTARNFVRGFLGTEADAYGTVITVNSTGSPDALFNSLSPGDLCPNFEDGNGGSEATTWDATYLPPITARLNALLTGNLTFTDSDVSLFPYLCGFESHITGSLSPWCSVFSNAELRQYEYRQDLRYYYGTGPGVDLASKMMLPFLNGLVGLLTRGPGQQGKWENGTSYEVPRILTMFLNDGQITQLGAGSGVWDAEGPLNGSEMTEGYGYVASRFVSMRGTFAFERLRCGDEGLQANVPEHPHAHASRAPLWWPFSFSSTAASTVAGGHTAPFRPYSTATTTSGSTHTVLAGTYIRILLNDAVYPVPSCRSGPGASCELSAYGKLIEEKLRAAGDLHDRCNVTAGGSPRNSWKGVGFLTDLAGEWLGEVKP